MNQKFLCLFIPGVLMSCTIICIAGAALYPSLSILVSGQVAWSKLRDVLADLEHGLQSELGFRLFFPQQYDSDDGLYI